MRTDDELLLAWSGGDQRAGHELFERHFASVFRFFRNKASGDVEDLVQTTFANCLKARTEFRGESSFRTYLLTVARHELYAHWKRRRRGESVVELGDSSVEDLGASPSGELAAHQDRRLLARALRTLPLDFQVALELFYWEELSGPELAAVLEVPEGTARSRLRRARELLKERFDALAAGEGGSTTASSLEDVDAWATALRVDMGR